MAGVIKADSTSKTRMPAQPVSFSFADMGQRATAYLDEVRSEAASIITAAHAEAEQIKQQAQTEGRQAALRAAESAIQSKLDEQLKQLLPALEAAAQQIVRAKDEWQRQWEKNLVQLAVRIAERVVRREIAQRPEITSELIREALELAAGSQKVTLHLHPADRAALGDRVQQLAMRMSKLGPVQVVSDETVTRGGCRVHTEFGIIDQQIEQQLHRIQLEMINDE